LKIIIFFRQTAGKVRRALISYNTALQLTWSLFLFRIRNYLRNDPPIDIYIPDASFRVIPKGGVALQLWRNHGYEQNELRFILNILERGMTFIDIGSNIGLFAMAAAKKIGLGKVYALEPGSWTFGVLKENIHLNGLTNVIPVRTALGDTTGQAVLQVNAKYRDLFNTIGLPVHRECRVITQETVPLTTLDNFIEDQEIAKVDVMKVDVEGAELLVFRGARNLLKRRDAPLILYESGDCTKGFDYHPVETMWLLDDYGYSLFVLDTKTDRLVPMKAEHGYNVMIAAVKADHPFSIKLRGNVQ
jgi:FkbM family methyltransferase